MRRLATLALLLTACGTPINYDVLTPAAAAERIRLKANSLILAAEEAAAAGDSAQLEQWETTLDDMTSAYFRGAK